MLLRFRVENHRSFRNAVELSLVSSQTKGAVPTDRDWLHATTRVAGIFGANASGKSTLLDAIDFLRQAVRYSATRWGEYDAFPHSPFTLDKEAAQRTSSYEIDFVVHGTRYNYGFTSDTAGVHEEWLYAYHTIRRTMLFERSGVHEQKFTFGRALTGENVAIGRLTRPTSLYLSTAANNNHAVLTEIYHDIARHTSYARCTDNDKAARLRWIRDHLDNKEVLHAAESLARFADLGIATIALEEQEMDSHTLAQMKRIFDVITEDSEDPSARSLSDVIEENRKKLTFGHHVGGDNVTNLPLGAESNGTVSWLALSVPAVQAMLRGNVFLVDEIDSSLHPRLTSALIHLFNDRSINTQGGQLVFTSHDATILGSLTGESLAPEEVWFTEKRQDGSSELYSLNEFQVRDSDNFERRYLHGRYGAVPIVEYDDLRNSLLAPTEK